MSDVHANATVLFVFLLQVGCIAQSKRHSNTGSFYPVYLTQGHRCVTAMTSESVFRLRFNRNI